MNRPCTIGWAMGDGPGPWTEHGPWTMNRPSTMGWAMHGPWTSNNKKFPFSLHIVASSSWTMDSTTKQLDMNHTTKQPLNILFSGRPAGFFLTKGFGKIF